MPRVLLTALGPYDDWPTNASWLALQELTRELPSDCGLELTTRLYPVSFADVAARLEQDLTGDVDYALHIGQAPRASCVKFETVGINWACDRGKRPEDAWPLVPKGPMAYSSGLPLARWAQLLRGDGIPAEVSHHAGTYVCNATLYLSLHLVTQRKLDTQVAFIHVPVDPSQVLDRQPAVPSSPAAITARGLRLVLDDIAASLRAR
jgi:pyroglutamyl-peptidase